MQLKTVLQGLVVTCAIALSANVQTAHAQFQSLDRIAFQFDQNQAQGGASNPIVGHWEQVQQARDGGVIHSFWIYGADGTYQMTSIQLGGAPSANGFRMQFWGTYQINPAGDGRYMVKTFTAGKLPMTICVPGYSCRSTGPIPHPQQAYYQFQGNMFQSTDGVTAQRSEVPQALMQTLPSTWNLQPPPPLAASGRGTTGGGSNSNAPTYHVPGQGGTCDNAQQQRVCTINNGIITTDRNGCQHCNAPY